MRMLDRKNDALLAIALIASALVVLRQPFSLLMEVARDVERRYHVDLIPGLAVLTCALIFHLYRRHQQARTAAAVAAAQAEHDHNRSTELEPFVAFSRALSHAIGPLAVQQLFWRYVSPLVEHRELWLLTVKPLGWDRLIRHDAGASADLIDAIEAAATVALTTPTQAGPLTEGVPVGDYLCFQVIVADSVAGVVGVRNSPALSPVERQGLGLAASLLGVAIANIQATIESRENSVRDQLTGYFNRSYGIEALVNEIKRATRTRRPLSVMMFDVDEFKTVNDRFGHVTGDAILKAVADHVARTLRATDLKCRYGGDEFLIILTDTPLSGAEQAAKGLTRAIGPLQVSADGEAISPTISVGVAAAEPSDSDPLSLITRADAALYKAKKGGRNQYAVAPSLKTHDGPRLAVPGPGSSVA
jgi:diguanylate cyclase (GGDEF)-like protein